MLYVLPQNLIQVNRHAWPISVVKSEVNPQLGPPAKLLNEQLWYTISVQGVA